MPRVALRVATKQHGPQWAQSAQEDNWVEQRKVNSELIREAAKAARKEGSETAKRRLGKQLAIKDQEISNLKRALQATGQEWACPECGSLILPGDVIRRQTDA